MREGCECSYCKAKVNEYFCAKCGYNFNECESFHQFDGMTLCPICHPKDLWCPTKPEKISECTMQEIEQEEEYLIDQHGHRWIKDTGEKT